MPLMSNQHAKYLGKVSHASDGRNSNIQTHRFFDDLLVHLPDLQTHLKTIKNVFMLLRKTLVYALTWKRLIK